MTSPRYLDAATIAAELAANIERLAITLLGEPNRALSTRSTWRWGRKGSFALEITGAKRGIWCDHEAAGGGDALDLVAYARRTDKRGAWSWACSWLGNDNVSQIHRDSQATAAPAGVTKAKHSTKPDTVALARKIWSEATAPNGTIVEAYLASRGLRFETGLPIRFHPQCPRDQEKLPAMLTLMTNPISGAPCGVHRTFLRPDGSGKADGVAKMMCGTAGNRPPRS